MSCYECALEGREAASVATCRHCGVALCLEHLRSTREHRVGGTLYGCPHDLSARARPATRPSASGRERVPAGVAG